MDFNGRGIRKDICLLKFSKLISFYSRSEEFTQVLSKTVRHNWKKSLFKSCFKWNLCGWRRRSDQKIGWGKIIRRRKLKRWRPSTQWTATRFDVNDKNVVLGAKPASSSRDITDELIDVTQRTVSCESLAQIWFCTQEATTRPSRSHWGPSCKTFFPYWYFSLQIAHSRRWKQGRPM